jgi:hypothetical protein
MLLPGCLLLALLGWAALLLVSYNWLSGWLFYLI